MTSTAILTEANRYIWPRSLLSLGRLLAKVLRIHDSPISVFEINLEFAPRFNGALICGLYSDGLRSNGTMSDLVLRRDLAMHRRPKTHRVVHKFAVAPMLAILCLCASGCVMPSYKYGRFKDATQPFSVDARNHVTRDSRNHPVLNQLEVMIHTPIEAVLGHVGLGNPDTRPRSAQMADTLDGTLEYLAENRLEDVVIDIRRYSPRTQWGRLRANRQVAPIWKYTLGSVYWAVETVIPARAFRYSYYNPFTNTLALNSIWHEWNIYEAARAKDFLGVRDPGLYAVILHVPFAPIYQEIRVGTDSLTYARSKGDLELELALYPFVYGEVFGGTVEEAAFLVPGLSSLHETAGPLIWASCFATGYAIGTAITELGCVGH